MLLASKRFELLRSSAAISDSKRNLPTLGFHSWLRGPTPPHRRFHLLLLLLLLLRCFLFKLLLQVLVLLQGLLAA